MFCLTTGTSVVTLILVHDEAFVNSRALFFSDSERMREILSEFSFENVFF